ncbi:MAG: hypothetical protein M0R77_07705 [Gammaproteobacteria bacterium]|nr:hypothetical protein [Gammaproteobacteria bacterium]
MQQQQHNIASNMSHEEILRYTNVSDEVRKIIDDMLDTIVSYEKEIEALNRSEERLSEQLDFARDLVETLDYTVNRYSRMADFKKEYSRVRQDTYFEI